MSIQAQPTTKKPLLNNSKIQAMTWSFSRLSTFETCERRFYYKYILGYPTPSYTQAKAGKIIHHAMNYILGEDMEVDVALHRAIADVDGLPDNESFSTLLNMLKKVYERLPNLDDYIVETEKEVLIKTTKGNVLTIADLVLTHKETGAIEIWDYKTSWVAKKVEEQEQLLVYAWVLAQKAKNVPITIRLVFPRLSENEDSILEVTKEFLDKGKQWLVKQINAVQKKDENKLEDWNLCANKSNCENCPFVGRCASGLVGANLYASGEPISEDNAVEIGQYILAQEALIKSMKAGLKKWVETSSTPIVVGEGEWKFKESKPNPKCDNIAALVDYAVNNELNVAEVLEAKSDVLGKWLESDESGELKQLVTFTSPRKTFSYSKFEKVKKNTKKVD